MYIMYHTYVCVCCMYSVCDCVICAHTLIQRCMLLTVALSDASCAHISASKTDLTLVVSLSLSQHGRKRLEEKVYMYKHSIERCTYKYNVCSCIHVCSCVLVAGLIKE